MLFFKKIFHLVKPEQDEFPSSVLIYLRYWVFLVFSVFNVKYAVSSFARLFQIQRTMDFFQLLSTKFAGKRNPHLDRNESAI